MVDHCIQCLLSVYVKVKTTLNNYYLLKVVKNNDSLVPQPSRLPFI